MVPGPSCSILSYTLKLLHRARLQNVCNAVHYTIGTSSDGTDATGPVYTTEQAAERVAPLFARPATIVTIGNEAFILR